MALRSDSLNLLRRAATGQFDEDVRAWISGAAQHVIKLGGALNLHECCGLPSTSKKMSAAQRDLYLCELVDLLHPGAAADCRSKHAKELEGAIDQFISRGPWRFWKDRMSPPIEATRVQVALFYVVRLNAGKGLSRRYIAQRLGGK